MTVKNFTRTALEIAAESGDLQTMAEDMDREFTIAKWLEDPYTWDLKTFIDEISGSLDENNHITPVHEEHLIATLGVQMEIYVACWKHIKENGLTQGFRNNVIGKNPHIAIGDKALSKLMLLMKELGLTEKLKVIKKTPMDLAIEELIKGPPK
jgi:phage terminase small subunit